MKLGQKVRFKRHWVKRQNGINIEHLTTEQCKELEENDCIWNIKRECVELDMHKVGIVAGVRELAIKNNLQWTEHSYTGKEMFCNTETVTGTFYLIACHMRGFYKVLAEDLEVAE